MIPINMVVLPNGKVLSWGRLGTPHVWLPSNGTFTNVPAPSNVFCAGHSFLRDGRLLVAGGHITDYHGLANANLFDYRTNRWTPLPKMRAGRWYPTNTSLPNGEQLTIAGDDANAANNLIPEVWQTSGGWRALTSARAALPNYPWMFVNPSGLVFYAGPEQRTMILNTAGTGSWSSGPYSHFGSRDYGAAAMYDAYQVIIVGGGMTPTNTAEIIDLNRGGGWKSTGSMAVARRQLNLTMLPDGNLLATGGTSGAGFNNLSGAAYSAELWSPSTGRWTTLASARIERLYHSVAVLLADGRVLVAGGGDPAAAGAHNEQNAEIFSPPYLFKPDGSPATRPFVSSAPSGVGYGQSFLISTPSASTVNAVTLIAMPSTTHGYNQNLRLLHLPFTRGAGSITVTAPSSPSLAPPGPYMLFLVGPGGTPSIAQLMTVG
jgi:hypothetical protein